MCDRVCVFSIDFHTATLADIPQKKTMVVTALQDGQIDAVISSWESWAGQNQSLCLSTHAEDTRLHAWGFARDAHWGQGVQLVEDHQSAVAGAPAAPLIVQKGERLRLLICFEEPGRNIFQVLVEREDHPSALSAPSTNVAAMAAKPLEQHQASENTNIPRTTEHINWTSRPIADAPDILPPSICDVPNLGPADSSSELDTQVLYGKSLPEGFWCPPRLRDQRQVLVEAMNDDYFAMLNDVDHVSFFSEALAALQLQGKRVLDIGAGAGLLSVLAARHGAKHVLAVESSSEMANLCQVTVQQNSVADKVQVAHSLSSCLQVPEAQRADVIVCEPSDIFLLGQGGGASLDYLDDARSRLAKPAASIVPAGGAQYAILITSSVLGARSTVCSHESAHVDLSNLGVFLDTGTVISSREKGFRLSSLPDLAYMSERACLFSLDFHIATRKNIPRKHTVTLTALEDGRVDAVMTSWDMWANMTRSPRLTAHAEDTKSPSWGFARDVVYGQGIQLVEELDAVNTNERNMMPKPFVVKKGEELLLTMHTSLHRDLIHFTLQRKSPAVAEAAAGAGRVQRRKVVQRGHT